MLDDLSDKSAKANRHPLVDLWFQEIDPEDGEYAQQGRVSAHLDRDVFLVEVMCWAAEPVMTTQPPVAMERRVVALRDMRTWRFHPTYERVRAAYVQYTAWCRERHRLEAPELDRDGRPL